ncbi:MAG: hypothetical protein HYY16_15730 [Planctomycetes bacterium]|nr:hypothetical protein [Planctomycetota bacterium]
MAGSNGQGLAGLERRFDEWRRLRQRRTRIPEPLWIAAVEAAREHGVCKTSRRLKIDYYSLKHRLAATNARRSGTIEFVEVAPNVLSAPACVLEMHDRQGRRLRVEMRDTAGAEALARTLWRDRR